jgi:hypothetical protein
VSLLWEEAAERPSSMASGGPGRSKAYRCVWW